MAADLPNHLRAYRRRDGLTQKQLIYLLGRSDPKTVSRYERYARIPDLETALACQVIFGVPAEQLFPGIYASVEARVHKRARRLLQRMRRQVPPIDDRTMAQLARLAERAGADDTSL